MIESRTGIIIQARLGSKRLPKKMLMDFHGKPIVHWVYKRVVESKLANITICSIPETEENDSLAHYLESIGAAIFRGEEQNVLDRFYKTAKHYKLKNIVRVCADNPLICSSEVDRLIKYFNNNSCDYAYNHIPKENNYPDGLGAEICNFNLLKNIYRNAKTKSEKEHVFTFLWNNSENFCIKTFNAPNLIAYPELKFDIDTLDDYANLLKYQYTIDMSAKEIISTRLQRNI